MEVIDISSNILWENLFKWQSFPDIKYEKSLENWNCCNISKLNNLNSHLWTHIDFPFHILKNWKKSGEYEFSKFYWECYVIEIIEWINIKDKIINLDLNDKILLIKTVNLNNKNDDYFFLKEEDTDFIISKWIKNIWVDTFSIDWFWNMDFTNHNNFFLNDILIYEWLELSKVEEWKYYFFWLPLKINWLEASLVRAFLLKL